MTPISNKSIAGNVPSRLQQQRMSPIVHFGHSHGCYLNVEGENSTVSGTYVLLTMNRDYPCQLYSPGVFLPEETMQITEASPHAESCPFEARATEFSNLSTGNPMESLDAIIASIRESRPLPAASLEVRGLISQAVNLKGK